MKPQNTVLSDASGRNTGNRLTTPMPPCVSCMGTTTVRRPVSRANSASFFGAGSLSLPDHGRQRTAPLRRRHHHAEIVYRAHRAGTSSVTTAGKLRKAAAVEVRMMRAMRPSSAPNFSASMGTLLALGSAATRTPTVSANRSRGSPSWIAALPTNSTSRGWTSSLIAATER